MKNRRSYIRAGLDMDSLQSYANNRRTQHLYDLMDAQEEQEQKDYNKFMRNRLYALCVKKFRDVLWHEEMDIQEDVDSIINQYGLDHYSVWRTITDYLYDNKAGEEFKCEDGVVISFYDSDECLNVYVSFSYGYGSGIGGIIFSIYIYEDGQLEFDIKNVHNFCAVVYQDYTENVKTPTGEEDLDEMCNFADLLLDNIVTDIKNTISEGIQLYLKRNPPTLQ